MAYLSHLSFASLSTIRRARHIEELLTWMDQSPGLWPADLLEHLADKLFALRAVALWADDDGIWDTIAPASAPLEEQPDMLMHNLMHECTEDVKKLWQ